MKQLIIFSMLLILSSYTGVDAQNGSSFYDLKFTSLDGKTVDFSTLKGKYVLVVNTASKCGYTPQYADLQKLSDRYQNKLVVIGFPSDNFGNQEFGTNEEIGAFCQKNYGVTFLLMEKSDVKGKNTNVVFQWLTDKEKNGWNTDLPTWNFCKYLIDPSGKLVKFFSSKVNPLSDEVVSLIQ